jgi:hypothetical protein
MRLTLLSILFLISSMSQVQAQSVELIKTRHSAESYLLQGLMIPKDTLSLTLTYAGGCKKDHQFKLSGFTCQDDSRGNRQCRAKIGHVSEDPCKALMYKTVHFPLSHYLPKLSFTLSLEDSKGQVLTTFIQR